MLLCDWDDCGEGDLDLVVFLCESRREGTLVVGPELSGGGLTWPGEPRGILQNEIKLLGEEWGLWNILLIYCSAFVTHRLYQIGKSCCQDIK